MSALLEVPTTELLKLWGDLVEAYHGVNGYGSTVAEIYAYRFHKGSVIIETCTDNHPLLPNELQERNNMAADGLLELCRLFFRAYPECSIKIEGLAIAKWRASVGGEFDHRAHVEIIRKRTK